LDLRRRPAHRQQWRGRYRRPGGTFIYGLFADGALIDSATINILDSDPTAAPTSLNAQLTDDGSPYGALNISVGGGNTVAGNLVTLYNNGAPIAVSTDGQFTFPASPGTTYNFSATNFNPITGLRSQPITTSPLSTPYVAPAVTAVPISPFTNVPFNGTVARFTPSGSSTQPADYASTIDWGDQSTPSAGTIVPNNDGTFSVQGQHTYAGAGSYASQVTVAHAASGLSGSDTSTAAVSDTTLDASLTPLYTRAGSTYNGVIATFTDTNPAAHAADFNTTVDYGDGNGPVAATVQATNVPGAFRVIGQINYATEGHKPLSVNINDNTGGGSTSIGGNASVAPSLMSAQGVLGIKGYREGEYFSGEVATFRDSNPSGGPYSASINWMGDGGLAEPATISGIGHGKFAVFAKDHRFKEEGNQMFSVSIHAGTHVLLAVGSADVLDGHMTAYSDSANDANPPTGQIYGPPWIIPDSNLIAMFGEYADPPITDFSATIHWGNGSTSNGTITQNPLTGGYAITGGHTFSQPVSRGWVEIRDDDVVRAVASFTMSFHSFPNGATTQAPTDLMPTLKDDTIPRSDPGTSDDPGGTGTGTGTVDSTDDSTPPTDSNDPPQPTPPATDDTGTLEVIGQPQTTVEGQGLPTEGALATFTDANTDLTADDYIAVATRADGSPIPVHVEGADGSFEVIIDDSGAAFPEEGDQTAYLTVGDPTRSVDTTADIRVLDANLHALPTENGTGIHLTGHVFSTQPIATFTDDNPDAPLSDFNATVTWGDNAISSSTDPNPVVSISKNDDGSYTVNASHTYENVHESWPVAVHISDVGGSVADVPTFVDTQNTGVNAGLIWDGMTQADSQNPGTVISAGASEDLILSAEATVADSSGGSMADLPVGATVMLELTSGVDNVQVWGENPNDGAVRELLIGQGALDHITWTKADANDFQFFPTHVEVDGTSGNSEDSQFQLVVTGDPSTDTGPGTFDATDATNTDPDTGILAAPPEPAKGGPAVAGAKAFVPADYKMDVMKINHNASAGALNRATDGKNIYIPVRRVDVKYDYAADDWLPIIVYPSPNPATDKIKFALSNVNLYQSDGSTLVTNKQDMPAPQQATTFYVEGSQSGLGSIDLYLNGKKTDTLNVNEFNWSGPLNVPQYGKYEYKAASNNALPKDSKWIDPTGGKMTGHGNGKVATDVDIQWNAGPLVGKASFQANANYIWDLEVNDVQVVVAPPDNATTFTLGTVVDAKNGIRHNVTTTGVQVGDKTVGIKWQAKVTLNGPNGNLGVDHIKAGFVQNLTVTKLSGTYADNAGTFVSDLQTGKINGGTDNTYWDKQDGFDGIFYTDLVSGFFADATKTRNSKTITSVDRPNDGPPNTMNGHALTAMDLVWDFKLFVVAQTTDTSNTANAVVASQSLAQWQFNGSGPINQGIWAGNLNGVTMTSDWVAQGADSPQPKTTAPRFNDLVNNDHFTKP
jgi:hypothetical protein